MVVCNYITYSGVELTQLVFICKKLKAINVPHVMLKPNMYYMLNYILWNVTVASLTLISFLAFQLLYLNFYVFVLAADLCDLFFCSLFLLRKRKERSGKKAELDAWEDLEAKLRDKAKTFGFALEQKTKDMKQRDKKVKHTVGLYVCMYAACPEKSLTPPSPVQDLDERFM